MKANNVYRIYAIAVPIIMIAVANKIYNGRDFEDSIHGYVFGPFLLPIFFVVGASIEIFFIKKSFEKDG